MIVYTRTRKTLALGDPIARGGEATVHDVQGARDTLAKIYIKPRESYDQKLKWMVANPPNLNYAHPSIAWPSEVLYDAHERLAGYLMPRISGAVKLLEVFNPRVRAQVMPKFNWRYLHRAARNTSAALAALHACDYVVGDLNESNILVMPTALVTLIDTDSFQVRAVTENRTELFPCPVARLEYTPPELQGHPLNEPRRPEHDNFGLAVLIFQLLMNGSHPFRGHWLSSGEAPAIEERIRNGWFPYVNTSGGRIAPLPNMLPFNVLDPQLTALFVRCFVDGHHNAQARPAAAEWRETLDSVEKNLVECPNHHVYARHLKACPWCSRQTEVARPAPAPTRAELRRQERRNRRSRRAAPVPRPVPVQPYAPFPTNPPFSAPIFPRGLSIPTPRVSPAVMTGALSAGNNTFRFGLTVVASLGSVLSTIARGMMRPDLRAWWRASVYVLSGAATGTLIWTIIGASLGALAGGAAALWDHVFLLNALLLHARDGALVGGSMATIGGLVFSLLSEAVARFRATGGALAGMLIGAVAGAFAPATLSGPWQTFAAAGMLLGGLFALASLPVNTSRRWRRLSAASAASLSVMQRLDRQSTWVALVGTALSTALLSMTLWLLAGTSAAIALVLAASIGLIGGVVVAVSARRP